MLSAQINLLSLLDRYGESLREFEGTLRRVGLEINYHLPFGTLLCFEAGAGWHDRMANHHSSDFLRLLLLIAFPLHVALDPFPFSSCRFHHILLVGLHVRQR